MHLNCFKRNCELWFEFSIQSAVFTVPLLSESKIILYLDTVYCKFFLYVEINAFKQQYCITITNLIYLGLVCVTMITGTRSKSMVARGVTGV